MEDEKQNSTHAGVSAPYKMIRVIHEKIIQLDFLNHIELEHKLYNDGKMYLNISSKWYISPRVFRVKL